jgi:hypothetical protein
METVREVMCALPAASVVVADLPAGGPVRLLGI